MTSLMTSRRDDATHLFRLQRELDEDLLQLLVDEVDAELLEAVSLQEKSHNDQCDGADRSIDRSMDQGTH